MSKDWETHLLRWSGAGLIEPPLAEAIRAWESSHARADGLRLPTRIIVALGAVLLAAGVLLFVSAHWDQLSPAWRMSLVVSMVAAFHVGGAAAERFEALSMALHAIGTVTLGAAIALAGQIFNISEHWPSAILMWSIGAAVGWALLRQWPQAALTAILLPAWLVAEWTLHMNQLGQDCAAPMLAGICALSLTYLSARGTAPDTPLRRSLTWIGGLAILPAATVAACWRSNGVSDSGPLFLAWGVAIALPLVVTMCLRPGHFIWNAAAVLWSALLPFCAAEDNSHILVYAWCAAGSVGLAYWGIFESRPERINLAMAGFAVTVLFFYFSNVMDKLGRSASLMFLGMLFLGGGWLLERTRRGLIARMRPEVV